MEWEDLVNAIILGLISGGIAWLVTCIILEMSLMTETDRKSWEITRTKGKPRLILQYILQGVITGLLSQAVTNLHFEEKFWKWNAGIQVIDLFD
jgi:hypothetical protein